MKKKKYKKMSKQDIMIWVFVGLAVLLALFLALNKVLEKDTCEIVLEGNLNNVVDINDETLYLFDEIWIMGYFKTEAGKELINKTVILSKCKRSGLIDKFNYYKIEEVE